jgi:hypothetical protein
MAVEVHFEAANERRSMLYLRVFNKHKSSVYYRCVYHLHFENF